MEPNLSPASSHAGVDLALVLAGAGLASLGWWPAAVPIVALGLVLPALRWRRRDGWVATAVPTSVASARSALVAAARRPGVPDGPESIRAADALVLEVATVLAGRPPAGFVQQRYVAGRVAALEDVTRRLTADHDAWSAARAELGIAPDPSDSDDDVPAGPVVVAVTILLAPLFLTWDLARVTAGALRDLALGIPLRLRTAVRLTVVLAAAALEQWSAWRRRLATTLRSARLHWLKARRHLTP